MRFTVFFATLSSFFLSLGIVLADNVPAGGRKLDPTTQPRDNAPIQSDSSTFSGTITAQAQLVPAQSQATLVKKGSGTLTLTGANTYTGTTTVTNGTLVVGGAMAAPAGTLSVDADGTRQSQNEEFGMKVKITDDPKKGIKIEQTIHKGGTDETKSYEAKDPEELKKKSPEAFKLYEKYLGNQVGGAGVLQINGGGFAPVQGGALQLQMIPGPGPMPVPMPGAGGGIQVIQAQAQLAPGGAGDMPIEVATQLMGQLSSEIDAAAKNSAWKDASKDERSAIKKQAESLKKRLGQLEKELEDK